MQSFNFELPEKLLFFISKDARYKVAYGGRGSGKSWTAARCLILLALKDKIRVLCTRQLQTSIKDSVHKLLSDSISEMGLSEQFDITKDAIRAVNGSEFIFKGLQNNTNEIKSIEGINYCWVEEAQSVSNDSWDILIPTVRQEGSEIWVTFNPDREEDATYQRFVKNTPPDAIVELVNYYDNPWFPEVLKREKEYDKSVDYGKYEHVWLGKTVINTEAQVYNGKFELKEFQTPDDVTFYYGADWGFANDPTAIVRCFIQDQCLYIDYESGGIGVEFEELPALFDKIPESRKWEIRADSARPETISYMTRQGFRTVACPKWKGSVEDGIEYIRSFRRIYVHPRCKHTYEEFKFYSYKTDKNTGDILPIVLDKNNHYCLTGDTLITTNNGQIPIKDIKIGDLVLTRKGYKKVLWSGITQEKAKVYTLKTQKGLELKATLNHKIFTNNAFRDMITLRYGDNIITNTEYIKWLIEKQLYMMGKFGTDTQVPKEVATDAIFKDVGNFCIIMFGKSIMDSVKKVGAFIILMVILAIIKLKIWKKSQEKNIKELNINLQAKNSNNAKNGVKTLDPLQQNGINPKPAENGINNTLKILILGIIHTVLRFVKFAAKSLKKWLHIKDFALMFVSLNIDEIKEQTILRKFVNFAVQNLLQTNIKKCDFVPDNVEAVTCGNKEETVYNITVDEEHEFFANGILVHNCDALRYALNPYIQKNISLLDVL